MRSLNFKKTIKNYTWAALLLIGALSLGIVSCSDDDSTDVDPGGTEAESAWMVGFNVPTEQGNIGYIGVYPEIPTGFDESTAVEVGIFQEMFSVGENPFNYDNNSKVVTKWAVNKQDLSIEVDGILSLAGTGYEGFDQPLIVSETQAFFLNVLIGIIVEWNPQDMTITEVYNVPAAESIHPNAATATQEFYVRGNNILIPVLQTAPSVCCDIDIAEMGAIVGVFDMNSGTLEYKKDSRLISGNQLMAEDDLGNLYAIPFYQNKFKETYFDITGAPDLFTMLRVDDQGNFDPNYLFDFSQYLDIEVFFPGIVFISDNKAVVTYADTTDSQLPSNFSDRFSFFSDDAFNFRTVVLDLGTGAVSNYTSFDKYQSGVFPLGQEDGVNYWYGRNGQVDPEQSFVLRQDGFDLFTEILSGEGFRIQTVHKLF